MADGVLLSTHLNRKETMDTDFKPSETPPEIADAMAAAHDAECVRQADERDAPIIDIANPYEFRRIVDKLYHEFDMVLGYKLEWATPRGQDVFTAQCGMVAAVLRSLSISLQVSLDMNCLAYATYLKQEPKL